MPRRPCQARSTSSAQITSCRWPVAIAAPARRSAGAASAEAQAPSEICLASAARSFRLALAEGVPCSTVSAGMPWGTPRHRPGPVERTGRSCALERAPRHERHPRVPPGRTFRRRTAPGRCASVPATLRQDARTSWNQEVSATAPAYLDSICQGAAALVLINSPGCAPPRSSQQITALADKPSHADVQGLSSPRLGQEKDQ
jgi:hypothetical protein